MPDLVLTSREGLVTSRRLRDSFSCTDHNALEFKILRASGRMYSKLAALDFRRAVFAGWTKYCGTKP